LANRNEEGREEIKRTDSRLRAFACPETMNPGGETNKQLEYDL